MEGGIRKYDDMPSDNLEPASVFFECYSLEGNRTRGSDLIPSVPRVHRSSSFSVVWETATRCYSRQWPSLTEKVIDTTHFPGDPTGCTGAYQPWSISCHSSTSLLETVLEENRICGATPS